MDDHVEVPEVVLVGNSVDTRNTVDIWCEQVNEGMHFRC
jgi:hypothetical protein